MRRSTASVLILGLQIAVCSADPQIGRNPASQAARKADGVAAPAVRSDHPRLFMTSAELPALRDRIAKHYRSEFQSFIDLLNDTNALPRRVKRIETNWAGFNYAFVAVLDPQEMARRGFNFKSSLNTSRAYCDRAMTSARPLLPGVANAEGQTGGALSTGFPVPKYLSVITTYDWCYPHLSDADRQAIVDAYVSAYKKKYEGQNFLTMRIAGRDMLGNDPASNDVEDVLGIVGFHGDPYPDAATQSELFTAFKAIWLDRFLVELNYFYGPGTGWHEGSGGYFSRAFTTLSIPVAMFSSALGVDYIARMPFFSEYPIFVEANTRPHSRLELPYYDRWGTISEGIAGPNCKNLMLNAGMLRRAGHPNAALAKWSHEKTARNCELVMSEYGGAWSNAVLFWFLYGDREVQPRSPTVMEVPTANEFGLGQHVMLSGYTSSDSQVIFYGQEHTMYGHDTPEYGTFTVHKFGNLILQAGNTKSGEGVLARGPDKGALFENLLTLHKGESDPGLGFTGGRQVDAFFGSRGIKRIGKAGTVIAATLNGRGFDYIGYDNLPMWSSTTASASQREFIYLHGPADKEFVVVLDRFHAKSPATDEKIWRIWVPTLPEFVNGAGTTPRPGQWLSHDSDTIRLTNKFDGLQGKEFKSAPTHGRFFMKTLLPQARVVSFLGGPLMEFQSGDGDGSTPWGAPALTQAEREYLGWGRVEVRPSVRQAYDVFLNVIQIGDADTLASMAPISHVDSATGVSTGAHIGDASNQWVVMAARAAAERHAIAETSYSFKSIAARSRHLLINMARSTTFHVRVSTAGAETKVEIATRPAAGSAPVTSNDQGVLTFEVNGTQVK
jgi:hypothetical protein